MAEQQQPVDPVTAFWRDVWARMTPPAGQAGQTGFTGMPGMQGIPGMGGMPGMPPVQAPMMTPDAMRKMQSAFFEAMAQYSEQYMKSPQFMESMKKSMDQALAFKTQMDEFLKNSMAQSLNAPGMGAMPGSNVEVMTAIRKVENDLRKEIGELKALVERAIGDTPVGSIKPAAKKPTNAR